MLLLLLLLYQGGRGCRRCCLGGGWRLERSRRNAVSRWELGAVRALRGRGHQQRLDQRGARVCSRWRVRKARRGCSRGVRHPLRGLEELQHGEDGTWIRGRRSATARRLSRKLDVSVALDRLGNLLGLRCHRQEEGEQRVLENGRRCRVHLLLVLRLLLLKVLLLSPVRDAMCGADAPLSPSACSSRQEGAQGVIGLLLLLLLLPLLLIVVLVA